MSFTNGINAHLIIDPIKNQIASIDSVINKKVLELKQLIQYGNKDDIIEEINEDPIIKGEILLKIQAIDSDASFAYDLVVEAIKNSQFNIIISLIDHFLQFDPQFINSTDSEGKTFLHRICQIPFSKRAPADELIKDLLSRGAFINCRDETQCTPFDYLTSAETKNEKIEKVLIQNKAQSFIKETKILAHIWKIDGKGTFGTVPFSYLGFSNFGMSTRFVESLIPFFATVKTTLPDFKNEDFTDLIEAIKALPFNLNEEPKTLAARPFFGLLGGWAGHSTGIYYFKKDEEEYLAKCNRHFLGVLIFKINNLSNFESVIKTFSDLSEKREGEDYFKTGMNDFLEFFHLIGQKQQGADNCTWAVLQALFLVMLFFHFFKKYNLDESQTYARTFYKAAMIYARVNSIQHYFLKYNTIGTAISKEYAKETAKAVFKPILEKINKLETKPSGCSHANLIKKLLGVIDETPPN